MQYFADKSFVFRILPRPQKRISLIPEILRVRVRIFSDLDNAHPVGLK
jgi:hypothetical protein